MESGKQVPVIFDGRQITILNQRSKGWIHPYAHAVNPNATLSSSGCGIFALCHLGQWLTGKEQSPEQLADFSIANDGRGDDGTDRPTLLAAMQEKGVAQRFGFRYEGDGLRNDVPELLDFLLSKRGVGLCNLRPGHIVALAAARIINGETQVLAVDSYSETLETRVAPLVREVIPASAITVVRRNSNGIYLGETMQFAMYWCAVDSITDFNLLHRF